jgi:putative transposase
LHGYVNSVLVRIGCMPDEINSVEDHIHILFELSRTARISDVVEEIKTTTSKWIKTRGEQFVCFRWQVGYSAFAVSSMHVPIIRTYIANQADHHKSRTFVTEYRILLNEHEVPFDERYMWD